MKLAANFVMTVDGKVQGPGAGYWPIGSPADLQHLLELRAKSGALVHGRLTAMGHDHIGRLGSPEFQALLKKHGQAERFAYIVVSAHPDELLLKHIAPGEAKVRVVLASTVDAELPAKVPDGIEIWQLGSGKVDLKALVAKLDDEGLSDVTLEAGPQLFGAFVDAGLVNELYVTVAPKLFGTSFGTPTMINGVLFASDRVPQLELVDHRALGSELYLHYKFRKQAA